ncbi:MAG: pyruvate ferredoxin oxidoreductase, partial [Fervidobacterium sp.]
LYDYYFEHKRAQIEAMKHVPRVFKQVADEFAKISGRKYTLIDEYMVEDAQYIMIALGSTAGTIKHTINELRKEGKKVGLLKPWIFRPFPKTEYQRILNGRKAVVVLDRSASFGAEAPLYETIKSALYEIAVRPQIGSYVYGLGGRDIMPNHIRQAFEDAFNGNLIADEERYLGLRE